MIANEIDHLEQRTRIAHNLGFVYQALQAYQRSLEYLVESEELAKDAGILHLQGSSLKTIGNNYYFLQDYQTAIDYYHRARPFFFETKNRAWQAFCEFDLAESYAMLNDFENAKRHIEAAQQIAQELGDIKLLEELSDLKVQHIAHFAQPEDDLKPEQLKGITYAREQGKITRENYVHLNACSSATASRHLNDLVEKGFLLKKGKGRSTHYVPNGVST